MKRSTRALIAVIVAVCSLGLATAASATQDGTEQGCNRCNESFPPGVVVTP
jgi:hypothetical protein